MNIEKVKAKKANMAIRAVGTDTVLVPLQENVAELSEMFTLNEVGSFIWEQLDYVKTLDELVSNVVEEFDVEHKTAKEDVAAFVAELDVFIAKS